MDLSSGLDEILQVCSVRQTARISEQDRICNSCRSPREEITQVDKLAVRLVFNIDDAPSVLATSNGLPVNNDAALGSYHGERDHILNGVV